MKSQLVLRFLNVFEPRTLSKMKTRFASSLLMSSSPASCIECFINQEVNFMVACNGSK